MRKEQMQANLSRQKKQVELCDIEIFSYWQHNKYCIGL